MFARLMCLTASIAAAALAAAPGASAASAGVDFSLAPSSLTVSVNGVFTVDIRVDASDQEVDTVEAHVDFDSTYLRVVDESGDLIDGIADGAILPGSLATTTLATSLLNRVDNDSGHADIACAIPPDGDPVAGAFVLGTVRFRALGEVSATSLTFHTAGVRTTMAVRNAVDVTGNPGSSTVVITAVQEQPLEQETTAGEGPSLSVTITSPADGATTSSPVQVVAGTVSDRAIDVATLTVSRRSRSIPVVDGRFREDVTLQAGPNTISVAIADSAGNVATSRVVVTLMEAPAGEATGSEGTAADEETPPASRDKPISWPMMGGIIGGLVAIGLATYFVYARTRY